MRRLLILTILFCTGLSAAMAQEYVDSRGRDFWFTFLPNIHNAGTSDDEHQLTIYIGSTVPTKGTITLRAIDGTTKTVPFNIADARNIFSYSTFYLNYELRGWNRPNNVNGDQCQRPAPQSVHVQADEEVSVYAMSIAPLTSDAFMVLPTDALGTDYLALSYYSDIIREVGGASDPTPSQFAVVATQDNTNITILPSSPTSITRNEPIEATLQQGESFLVQGANLSANYDLSGSIIRADKPIAVFSGHQRARVPIRIFNMSNRLTSRDCLIEQMNPVSTWGKKAYLSPLTQSSDEEPVGFDIYRVLAAFDSTVIYVDDVAVDTIMSQGVYEAALTQAHVVATSRPTLVGVYKKTSGLTTSGGSTTRFGDPFMMLVPPAEQFMSEYRIINAQSYQTVMQGTPPEPVVDINGDTLRNPVFTEQFMNIVIPNEGIESLVLDFGKVSPSLFTPIGNSGYSYASVVMQDGVHNIKSDSTFGVYVYGYGRANSYGYIGGMSFRPLDNSPPQINVELDCYAVKGSVTDSIIGDTQLQSVVVEPGSEENMNVSLDPITPPQRIVRFTANLINKYRDGQFRMTARDGARQFTYDTVLVPGFTIGFTGAGSNEIPSVVNFNVPMGKSRCDSVEIENYGIYVRTVTKLSVSANLQMADTSLPFDLQPGEKRWLKFCRIRPAEAAYIDTIFIGDDCIVRPAIEVRDQSIFDRTPPTLTSNVDSCKTTIEVKIVDNAAFDFGLEYAYPVVDQMHNISIVDSNHTDKQAPSWRLQVLDPFEDAVFVFTAKDSAGNVTNITDTLFGFTLEIASVKGPYREQNMGQVAVGTMQCYPVVVHNYGASVKTVSDIYISDNVLYSVPASQLPVSIDPGASVELMVCVSPLWADTVDITDTLTIRENCVEARLAVISEGIGLDFTGIARCNIPLGTNMFSVGKNVVLSPSPAEAYAKIALPEETGAATIKVVSIDGIVVLDLPWHGSPTKGLQIDVTSLVNGTYTLIVETEFDLYTSPLLIHR